jgi:hypothetical protein
MDMAAAGCRPDALGGHGCRWSGASHQHQASVERNRQILWIAGEGMITSDLVDVLAGLLVRCLVGSFDQLAPLEPGPGAHQGDQVRAVDRPPAALGSLQQLDTIASPVCLVPGPLVTLVLARTGANELSMGLVVRRCNQCSAG